MMRVLLVGDLVRRQNNRRVGKIESIADGDFVRFRYLGSPHNNYANSNQLLFVSDGTAEATAAPPWGWGMQA